MSKISALKATATSTSEGLSNQTFRECSLCAQSIREAGNMLPEAAYFIDLSVRYFDPEWIARQHPKIIVLGTSVPDEVILAISGTVPFWIVGGGREAAEPADSYVPRDTDPVTRSILGYLLSAQHMAREALVIVPVISDGQRKLAYLLQILGWKVAVIDIPPEKNTPEAQRQYIRQISDLAETVSAHHLSRFSRTALVRRINRMDEIRQTVRAFTAVAQTRRTFLADPLRMLILNSFYMTDDPEDWHSHLTKLTNALAGQPETPESGLPKILLIGSPIYFPCYKIPFLLSLADMEICGHIDPSTWKFETAAPTGRDALSALAKAQLENDCSGAYINNDALWEAARVHIERSRPDGVIWHVLKGQIEYDFELLRLESRFEALGLPVFRLETDYQYQDVEQLRIRIEAFGELLDAQRRGNSKRGRSFE